MPHFNSQLSSTSTEVPDADCVFEQDWSCNSGYKEVFGLQLGFSIGELPLGEFRFAFDRLVALLHFNRASFERHCWVTFRKLLIC